MSKCVHGADINMRQMMATIKELKNNGQSVRDRSNMVHCCVARDLHTCADIITSDKCTKDELEKIKGTSSTWFM